MTYSAFLVAEDDTMSSFFGVAEVIARYGLFNSLYTDRGSHYWHTAKAGGKVDRINLTQFGRAMTQLGIEMIPAYSPEARGRSERAFGTLQDRLPKELLDAGITEAVVVNRFLKRRFVRACSREFMVAAAETGSAFVPGSERTFDLLDNASQSGTGCAAATFTPFARAVSFVRWVAGPVLKDPCYCRAR